MLPNSSPKQTKSLLTVFALMLTVAATSFAAPEKIVINSYTKCSQLSPELSSACLQNSGNKEPFIYFEVRNESDCYAFPDSAVSSRCLEKINAREIFQIPKSDIDPQGSLKEYTKTPMEQVAQSTKTLVIISAINLGITIVGITTVVILFLLD